MYIYIHSPKVCFANGFSISPPLTGPYYMYMYNPAGYHTDGGRRTPKTLLRHLESSCRIGPSLLDLRRRGLQVKDVRVR